MSDQTTSPWHDVVRLKQGRRIETRSAPSTTNINSHPDIFVPITCLRVHGVLADALLETNLPPFESLTTLAQMCLTACTTIAHQNQSTTSNCAQPSMYTALHRHRCTCVTHKTLCVIGSASYTHIIIPFLFIGAFTWRRADKTSMQHPNI